MPYTISGCGTKYYGHREEEHDGSYITTEWIVLLFLPLIPIGSFRVRLFKSALMSSRNQIRKVPLHWQQIANIYLGKFLLLGMLLTGYLAILSSNSTLPPETAISVQPTPSPYVRPTTADNGQPFPANSGYIKNYPVQAQEGRSELILKNDGIDSDLFVKVFSRSTGKAIRVFFLRAHESFTAKDLTAGTYDIRYRDLDSGSFTKTDEFQLTETKDADKITYSSLTISLQKVVSGNMNTEPIPAAAFE